MANSNTFAFEAIRPGADLTIDDIESIALTTINQTEVAEGVYALGWVGRTLRDVGRWVSGAAQDIAKAMGKLLTSAGGRAVQKALCVAFGAATGTGAAGAAVCSLAANGVAKLLVSAGEGGEEPPEEAIQQESNGLTFGKMGTAWLVKESGTTWRQAAKDGRLYYWQPGQRAWINSQAFPTVAQEIDKA